MPHDPPTLDPARQFGRYDLGGLRYINANAIPIPYPSHTHTDVNANSNGRPYVDAGTHAASTAARGMCD
ncbi:MAG: hypothetical protein ACP5J4_20065 [Anaerolineae bacterium]